METPPPGGARAVPTYDYQCRSCGVISEVVHSMLEDGPTTCERCGGELRRLVHPTGIIFKGSGFYKTDSRSSSSGSGGGASRSTAPSSTDGGSPPTSTDGGSSPKGSGSTSGGGDAAKGSTGSD
jgi:putative FmdB family regulatory protein